MGFQDIFFGFKILIIIKLNTRQTQIPQYYYWRKPQNEQYH